MVPAAYLLEVWGDGVSWGWAVWSQGSFNQEKSLAEKGQGSGGGSGRDFSEEKAAALPVGRVIQEADSLREAVLAGLVPGEVAEGLRDVVRRAVKPVVQGPAPLSDRQLSRRFTELTDKKTTLKFEKQRGQVEKAREHLEVEEEILRRIWWGHCPGGRGQGQLVRPRATEVLDGTEEDSGERGEEREGSRRSLGVVARLWWKGALQRLRSRRRKRSREGCW